MGNPLSTLLTSANALRVYGKVFDTIQNNITNAHTPGYVKQDQSLLPALFDPSAGLPGGVLAGPLISARSEYVEQAVRNKQEQIGSAQQKDADLGQLQQVFSLDPGSGLPGALKQIITRFFSV